MSRFIIIYLNIDIKFSVKTTTIFKTKGVYNIWWKFDGLLKGGFHFSVEKKKGLTASDFGGPTAAASLSPRLTPTPWSMEIGDLVQEPSNLSPGPISPSARSALPARTPQIPNGHAHRRLQVGAGCTASCGPEHRAELKRCRGRQ
jgi:hypothetical protein